MKVFLEHPPGVEIEDGVVECDPTVTETNKLDLSYAVKCPHCGGMFFFVYRRTEKFRLHDDGTLRVYTFVGIE